MNQAWFSVAGLSLDIVGFGLIISEWWRGTFDQRIEHLRGLASTLDEVMRRPDQDLGNDKRLVQEEIANLTTKLKTLEDGRFRVPTDVESRGKLVTLGAALVLLGFFLQILGNLPVDLGWLGITTTETT